MPIRLSRNGRAARLNALANERCDAGDVPGALDLYGQAARAQPAWAVPWFNLGLLHKYRGEWQASLDANQAALARDPSHEGAVWNAGIAATALEQWRLARALWRRYGIDMPDSDAPPAFAPSLTPIRVNLSHAPEVLWADRICPARAVIRSVPTPASGRRYGDVLLHDGAPNGTRRLHGREVPVFDELQVLAPSDHDTWTLQLDDLAAEQADALVQRLVDADLPAEDWTRSLRSLCKACSEGRADDDPAHTHPAESAQDDRPGSTTLALALRRETDDRDKALALLATLPQAATGRWECVLPAHGEAAKEST